MCIQGEQRADWRTAKQTVDLIEAMAGLQGSKQEFHIEDYLLKFTDEKGGKKYPSPQELKAKMGAWASQVRAQQSK